MQSSKNIANNFDFLRVTAAAAVLISHQYALTGQPEPITPLGSWGGLGVLVFFAISGYLVTASWVRDPHLGRFAGRRLLRIWPGLFVATMIMVLALGPAVSTLKASEFWRSPATTEYVKLLGLWNFYSQLPGIFSGNILAGSANGSLWTIPIEIRCYAILAIVGALGLLRRPVVTIALSSIFFVWFFFYFSMGYDNPLRMQIQMGVVFLAAACMQRVQTLWDSHKAFYLIIAAGVITIAWEAGLQELAFTLGLPIIVVIVGSYRTPFLNRFGRFGDVSYGLYIFAYPVQQTVIWLGGATMGFTTGLAISFATTIVLAWLSWHCVERPALNLKHRL